LKNNAILNLTGANVFETIDNADLAIIPFGSVEYHGPHAALGTDSHIAQELGSRVGKRLNAILCPLVAYTTCSWTQHNPGTLHIDPDVMTDYIEGIFRGLFNHGVKGLLALNAHDGNIDTVRRAAERVALDHPDRFVLLINWWETLPAPEIESLELFSQHGGHGHGGPLETSAAWAVAPDSVDLSKAEDLEVDFGGGGMMSILNDGENNPDWPGYQGRISESSIRKGERLLDMAEEKIVNLLQDWLNERTSS